MTLNLNLGLFLITQNHVFPSSWPVWVESLYFDLHYKYMFYNNCYTCALYIVHHYDISYLTPFVFLFYKKGWIKAISPPAPPLLLQLCPFITLASRCGSDLWAFPFSHFLSAVGIQTGGQGARWGERSPSLAEARPALPRMASSAVQEATGSGCWRCPRTARLEHSTPGCARLARGTRSSAPLRGCSCCR